jgi:hypothetical protein
MLKSESIKNLSAALLVFDAEMGMIGKSSTNPFFKNKYAPLPDILAAIKDPLIKAGLTVKQFPEIEHGLTTMIMHADSGEWISTTYTMKPAKDDPQGEGSRITYQRRYALGAVLGLNIDVDDDGNKASTPGVSNFPPVRTEDDRPWLSDIIFKSVIERIKNNDKREFSTIQEFANKIYTTYKMKKEYKSAIEEELARI